jgi:hypothetical protein
MDMVGHDGVGEDIDSEDGGEEFQSFSDPIATVFEGFPGDRIIPSQEGPSNTSLDTVSDGDIGMVEGIGPFCSWHGISPCPVL